MNKQPKLIDADKLIYWARKRHGEGWNTDVYSIIEAISDGEFDPDPIPLPTIKPGDKVQRKLTGLYLGIVLAIENGEAIICSKDRLVSDLEISLDSLEVSHD